MVLLKFFAKADVEGADDEECHHNADKNQVAHRISPVTELAAFVHAVTMTRSRASG